MDSTCGSIGRKKAGLITLSESCNGSLFVVGGAEDRENSRRILHRFVQTSGGDNARIAVVATASTVP